MRRPAFIERRQAEREKKPSAIREIPWAGTTQKNIYIALFGLSLIASYSFVSPGYPVAGDVWPHLVRTRFVYDWLREGNFPFFSFFFYSGFPALRFYSPLPSLLSGTFALFFGGDVFWATKILLFLVNIISGFTFYWFLKKTGRDPLQSLLGAIVYLLVPWRTMYVVGIGTYPLALIFLFLPFSLFCLERLLKKPTLANSCFLGISLSLLILSHFVYTIWSFLFLFLYLFFRLLPFANQRRPSFSILPYCILSLLIAFSNSAFFLLPFIKKFASHSFPQVYSKLPSPNPLVLTGLRAEIGGYTGAYLGWSIILLIGLAIYYRAKNRQLFKDEALVGVFLSLLLTFLPVFLKRGEPLFTAGLPPQRFLAFFVLFSPLLIIDGFCFLKEKLLSFRITGNTTFYIVFFLIILDCLPRVILFPYENRTDLLGLRDEIYELLKREPVAKVVDIDIPMEGIDLFKRVCRYPAMGFLFANLPSVYGPPYHQFAAKNMLYVYPWINSLAGDLGDSTTRKLSDKSLKIIRLCGISHLITLPTLLGGEVDQTLVLLKKGLIWDDRFIVSERKPPLAIGKYPFIPSFLASNLLIPLPSESLVVEKSLYIAHDWEELLEDIDISHEKGSCNFIPLRKHLRCESLPGPEPEITLRSFSIAHNEIKSEIIASKNCFLRAATSFYPEIEVLIDGKPVPVYETKDHFLCFPFPSGSHWIKIRTQGGKIERYSSYISLFSSFISLILAFFIPKDRDYG